MSRERSMEREGEGEGRETKGERDGTLPVALCLFSAINNRLVCSQRHTIEETGRDERTNFMVMDICK